MRRPLCLDPHERLSGLAGRSERPFSPAISSSFPPRAGPSLTGATQRPTQDPVPLLQLAALTLGVFLVLRANLSVVRTFVLPRAANDTIARLVFRSLRRVFDAFVSRAGRYPRSDAIMAYFGPAALMALPIVWLLLVGAGYALIYWALGVASPSQAITDSGSSLLTLGFARPAVFAGDLLAFSEAVIGLGTVALLISYLPTIYSSFSRREILVRLLETRAGSPPSPVVLIARFHQFDRLGDLEDLWERGEQWFAELEESHTSLTVLVHFRSPRPDRSWANAAGALLDAAGIVRTVVAVVPDPRADLLGETGSMALRRIAAVFHVPLDPAPTAERVRGIDRVTFDAAITALDAMGIPLQKDQDDAWRAFREWRASYDESLLALQRITVAPPSWCDPSGDPR